MTKNVITILLILIIFIFSHSHASIVLNFRKVIHLDTTSSATTQNPPLPSPVVGEKELNGSVVDAGKPPGKEKQVKENPKDPAVKNNGTTTAVSPPNGEQSDKGQSHEGKENVGDKKDSPDASCEGFARRCQILNTMTACILNPAQGSKMLVVLIQNQAEKTLKVKLTPLDNALQAIEIPSHQTKKINISAVEVKTKNIVLNTEYGDCTIADTAPPSGKNFFKQLSYYSKQVTPIYGLYLFFLVALLFGGTWAFCKLRKRRRQGGVPYQELEMGLPESAAVNVESAEGWDEDWDDNWDEDNAVMSPGGRHIGSISANGLTSRSSKKDGWEGDWED